MPIKAKQILAPLAILTSLIFTSLFAIASTSASVDPLEAGFASPPDDAKPWTYWFWIDGNVSKEGITKDLESFKEAGLGGAIWIEVAGTSVNGPWWAPTGTAAPYSDEWNEAIQWAISESSRLGLRFGMTADFGYGMGGPHITPENSMQMLYWSETEVSGGKAIELTVPKPEIERKPVHLRVRNEDDLNASVLEAVEQVDSYRDVAVLAFPLPSTPEARTYRIPNVAMKSALKHGPDHPSVRRNNPAFTPEAVIPQDAIIDLSSKMGTDGRLRWNAPAGDWLILRIGHASNFRMNRPTPAQAIGLQADRLSKSGVQAHLDAFLNPIVEAAGAHAGESFAVIHLDSWEADYQNWTASFPQEFKQRRGYDINSWLPVLTGRVVGSQEDSDQFLNDMTITVSDLFHDNFSVPLRDFAHAHGMQFSHEAYGFLRVDNLSWSAVADIPMCEFWQRGPDLYPRTFATEIGGKLSSSVANTYGKKIVMAESFTSDRGWQDHPFLFKATGDNAFLRGSNRLMLHLSAHQPYENAIPGLTHRKWGSHFNRFNTWWNYIDPWTAYLQRAQFLLQEGTRVADILYWPGEALPITDRDYRYGAPKGYDYDLCSTEILMQLKVKDGRVVAPSGVSYAYLDLRTSTQMSLPILQKIEQLAAAGARIVGRQQPVESFTKNETLSPDAEVAALAEKLWSSGKVINNRRIPKLVQQDKLPPAFEGGPLGFIQRQAHGADIFFVANLDSKPLQQVCAFRVTDRQPELWDPESGEIRSLPEYTVKDGQTQIPLEFAIAQSVFIVFRDKTPTPQSDHNYPEIQELATLDKPWTVQFDAKWGGPQKAISFDTLEDWTDNEDFGIRHYSGTAVYRSTFELDRTLPADAPILLDLGQVEVMARVKVNGQACGIAWRPPFRVEITDAIRQGSNQIEIDVVNLWVNRMIGDEYFPLDSNRGKDETLMEWPAWLFGKEARPQGRYTFTTGKHFDAIKIYSQTFVTKDSKLYPSGLLGPIKILSQK